MTQFAFSHKISDYEINKDLIRQSTSNSAQPDISTVLGKNKKNLLCSATIVMTHALLNVKRLKTFLSVQSSAHPVRIQNVFTVTHNSVE